MTLAIIGRVWQMIYIVLACAALGCTSPYIVLTREQSEAIETHFSEFGAQRHLTPMCMMADPRYMERQVIDLTRVGPDTSTPIEAPPRWTYTRGCRFFWYDNDSLIHVIALSNWRDKSNTIETWSFGTLAQTEDRFEVRRLDTLFARSNDVRTFSDSIPSYLEQAYAWTIAKHRDELPRVWPR